VSLTSSTATALAINALDIGSTGDAPAITDPRHRHRHDLFRVALRPRRRPETRSPGTISAIDTPSETRCAARSSRIVDVDVAAETAELTKNNILQQAALAVLAQANQQPSSALTLLRN
jgi:hypothetical protein